MAKINNYAVGTLKVNDKLLASDGDTGATKNVSPEDVAELNGGASIYRAFLTQSGTNAPTAVVVGPNTIGNIVWTRSSSGAYVGTLTAAFVGYVAVVMCPNGLVTFSYNNTDDAISIGTYEDNAQGDGLLNEQYIEIRVYNI